MSTLAADLDRRVVLRGTAAVLVLAAPGAAVNTILSGHTPKPAGGLALTFLVILVGFVVGGRLAGSEAPRLQVQHAAVTSLLGFVIVEAIGIVGRLGRHDVFSLAWVVFNGTLMISAGAIGGLLAARRPPQPGRT